MAKDSIEESQTELEKSNADAEPMPVILSGPLPSEQPASPIPIARVPSEKTTPSERREIAKSATLVMLGNLGSSIMGMVRQIVVTAIGTRVAGPFNSALLPAQTFNDFLINGSVSGALIPTFSDYSAPEQRDELRR